MWVKFAVVNSQGSTLEFPFDSYRNGYLFQGMDGLDPVDATIVSSSFANIDGNQEQSSRRGARNITTKLGLKAGAAGTVSSLRTKLMGFFMPKSQVKLIFYRDDGPEVEIIGTVEKFTCPIFTKDPVASISIMCYHPYNDFYIPHIYGSANYTTPLTDEHEITYEGTIETGFEFRMTINRSISQFTIYHRSNEQTINQLLFAEPLIAGDVLTISTVSGNKHVTLTRAGSESSLLIGMSPDSNWLQLWPGENYFRVAAVGAPIPYTITYTSKLGGL